MLDLSTSLKIIAVCMLAAISLHATALTEEEVKTELIKYGVTDIVVVAERGVYIKEDASGFFKDLSLAVFRPLAIPINFKLATFRETMLAIGRGEADLTYGLSAELTPIEYPSLHVIFSELPVFEEDVWLLCRLLLPCKKEDLFQRPDSRYAELAGYGYAKIYDLPVKVTHVVSFSHAVKLMRSGRLDYMLHDANGLGVVSDDALAYFQATLFAQIETHATFNKSERGRLIKSYFDLRIKTLLISGELLEIYQKAENEGPWNVKFPDKLRARLNQ